MKTEIGSEPREIEALSFDKMLEVSNVMRDAVRYGKYCCIKKVSTSVDKDIFKYPAKVNAFMLVVCSNGLIEMSYNIYRVRLTAGSMFLYHPGTILQIHALEPSDASILVFTREFVADLGVKFDNVPLQYHIVHERQSFPLSEDACAALITMLDTTSHLVGLDSSNAYYHEMVKSSFRSFIYRALYEINALYGMPAASSGASITHTNSQFERFMHLLQDNYMRHHSIKFYADSMNLTPKYLSLMIKRVSGRLATQWIDDYVVLEAKNLIRYSAMSIQEIAYTLNFPNQSFFGKYFKRHTGISPKAYRLQP